MKYDYLVSYSLKEYKKDGIGRSHITTRKKLKTSEQICKLETEIAEVIKSQNVVVINFILLKRRFL